jgi:hypothetical protein
MTKTLAILFGVVFLLIGVLGFVPSMTKDEMLLGIFHVNMAHNVVHLLSGAIALFAGMASIGAARTYFRIFGIVYALVAVLGFMTPNGLLLGVISNNPADTYLHVAIALVSLIIGFAPAGTSSATT